MQDVRGSELQGVATKQQAVIRVAKTVILSIDQVPWILWFGVLRRIRAPGCVEGGWYQGAD